MQSEIGCAVSVFVQFESAFLEPYVSWCAFETIITNESQLLSNRAEINFVLPIEAKNLI